MFRGGRGMIKLSKSSITRHEKKAVLKVLDDEYLGMGVQVQDFENLLTRYFGRPVVCVANGTSALHLALQACKLGPGDEVLVQSLTYVASFQAISAVGAIPIACDIDADSLLINLEDAERKITPKTRAIMPVHYSGDPGDMEGLYDFAHRHKLRVIEDAAHAFGSIYKDKRVGSVGDIACFSFDGIKNITCGEGGCIVTEDLEVLTSVKDARLLGVIKDTDSRYAGNRSWEFDVIEQGWRYHMSNIMAAIGIEQFKRFPGMSKKRQDICRYYDELIKKSPRITSFERDYEKIVPHIYVIQLQDEINRNELQKRLLIKGIQTGIHYYPNHWLSKYKINETLVNTEKSFKKILTLPLHVDLKNSELEYVICSVNATIEEMINEHQC